MDMSLLTQPFSLTNSNYNITGLSNSEIAILQEVMLSLVTLLPYASPRVQQDFISMFSTKVTNVAVGEASLVYDSPSAPIADLVMGPEELLNLSLSQPPANFNVHTGATFLLTSSSIDTSLPPDIVILSDVTLVNNLTNIISLPSVAFAPLSSEVVIDEQALSQVTLTPVRLTTANSLIKLHHPSHISQCGQPIPPLFGLVGNELVESNNPSPPIVVKNMGCEELSLFPTPSSPLSLPTNLTSDSTNLTHPIYIYI
jgi:hypothetical protein